MKNKPFVIGLDLGGTNAVFGLVDEKNDIKTTTIVATQDFEYDWEFVDAAVTAINEMAVIAGGLGNIRAMGIGAPCGNYNDGTIEHAANIRWAKGVVPLAKMFADSLGIPVAITNDAKAAALGEMHYGAAQGMKNFIEITLGTGVGSGIVVNGQLIYGCDGFAGELGHTIIDFDNGRPCGCGRSGCLDMYCSTRGVIITAKEMTVQYEGKSQLKEIPSDQITTLDIYNAAEHGDCLAQEVLRRTGETLGKACANFATFLSPEAFVFFGGLAKAGDFLLKPAKEAYDKYVLNLYKGKAKFLQSGLEDGTAAILGAAAVGWEAK